MDYKIQRNIIAWLNHSEAAWHSHGKPVRQPAIQQVDNLRYGKGSPSHWPISNTGLKPLSLPTSILRLNEQFFIMLGPLVHGKN
jgi:hypothetical protein